MKGFATSLSIILSCFASAYLFNDVDLNVSFTMGACIVLGAMFAFSYKGSISPLNISPKNANTKI
jgi:hypothetical protein